MITSGWGLFFTLVLGPHLVLRTYVDLTRIPGMGIPRKSTYATASFGEVLCL